MILNQVIKHKVIYSLILTLVMEDIFVHKKPQDPKKQMMEIQMF